MDNYYANCPPKMSDGRHMTDYTESTLVNEQIKYVNGIIRDDEYRMFLQEKAVPIMNREWDFLKTNKSCWTNECVHVYPSNMYPGWFAEEITNYNSLVSPTRTTKFVCPAKGDYRMGYNIGKYPQKIPPKTEKLPNEKLGINPPNKSINTQFGYTINGKPRSVMV